MKADKIIKSLEILKDKNKEGILVFRSQGFPYYYDEEFDIGKRNKKSRELYRRCPIAWIAFYLDNNYPTNRKEYVNNNLLSSIRMILDISSEDSLNISCSSSMEELISTLQSILEKEFSLSEIIKGIYGSRKYN